MTEIHVTVYTVRNADRKVVEFGTLCDKTIKGEPVRGTTTCPECLRREAML